LSIGGGDTACAGDAAHCGSAATNATTMQWWARHRAVVTTGSSYV
jgi:hypothetical protein